MVTTLLRTGRLASLCHRALGVPSGKIVIPDSWYLAIRQVGDRMHREFWGHERNCLGWHCWARGACVSTVGLDEPVIRKAIDTSTLRTNTVEFADLGVLHATTHKVFLTLRHGY
jgi:hypothetical protein